MNLEAKLERLIPAFYLCLVKWTRELHAAGKKLQRPFDSYAKIMAYIDAYKEECNDGDEKDVERRRSGREAMQWLRETFVAAAR